MSPRPLPREDYRLVFESNPHPMWVFDRETLAFLAVNDAAIRHYGYSREEFLSMTLREIRPPEDLPAFDAYMERSGKGGIPADTAWVGIWNHRKKDGTVIEAEIWRTPVDFRDRPSSLAMIMDVTERRRTESALRESEARFRSAFSNADIGMALTAPDGRFLQVNRALCRTLGYSESELVSRRFRDVTHPDDVAGGLDALRRMLAGEMESVQFEKRYLRKDGETVWAFLTASIIRDPGGRPLYFVAQMQNITVRKRAEEKLRRAHEELERRVGERTAQLAEANESLRQQIVERERAEGEIRVAAESTRRAYDALKSTQGKLIQVEKLASVGMVMAGVAHEINNPLNVIYGNLRLLKDSCVRFRATKGPTSDDMRKMARMLEDALRAAENARTVVDEFRHFARDAGAAEVSDLRRCVEEAVEQVRPHCDGRIRIVRKLAKLPEIRILRGPIRRAVTNLLRNAVDAIEGSGTVTVSLARRQRDAVLEIRDTGRGIAPEHLDRIFEPFFTTKPTGRGFGLGLSLCQAVVQTHGGRISVRSRPGKGSCFTVRLPLGKKKKSV